jgi:hypothetical protein
LRSRRTLCCLAFAILPAFAGCQGSGSGGNSDEHSWWDWGAKNPPPSNKSGSPFSTAATYNRNNTSDMGVTLYDGTSHATPTAPPCNQPAAPANPNLPANPPYTTPPAMNPGAAYPQNYPMYANAGAAPAPTGYWVYQPAAGSPVVYPNGGAPVIPVYSPPQGVPGPVPGPAMQGNGPMPAPNPIGFNQPGAYPANNPAMVPTNPPVYTPLPGNVPPPGLGPAEPQRANPPAYGAPAGGDTHGMGGPVYEPGRFLTGPSGAAQP